MEPRNPLPGTPHFDMVPQNPTYLWPSYRGFPFPQEESPGQGRQQGRSNFGEGAKLPVTNPVFIPPQRAFAPPQKSDFSKRSLKQRGKPPKASSSRPSKRQRVAPRIHTEEEDDCLSETGSQSTCCSSCPDSPPCAEPDCSVVVPCTDKTCQVPVCTEDACLDFTVQNQLTISDHTTSFTNWDHSHWNPQAPKGFPQNGQASHGTLIDPALGGFTSVEYQPGGSPYSNPPSMINNDIPTPYSPNTSQHTPQPTVYNSNATFDHDLLSGAGSLFPNSTDAFPGQSFGLSNNSDLFNCRWDGCSQSSFPSQDDWIPHLHQEHLHPQLSFRCPIPGESCPPDIGFTHLFGHLENDHGYNFFDDLNFSCPAPNCDPSETFCDPSMLHNHFDHAHATPTRGMLECQIDACNTEFTDHNELAQHITQDHNLPVFLPSAEDIDLTISPEVSKIPALSRENILPNNDSIASILADNEAPEQVMAHTCKWVTGYGMCGKVCASEVDLQSHITKDHLNSLDKTSGYNCQWEGCSRHDKRGEKSGFSQRGKLERHMATHTGYKCSACDICGKTFSAEQSMKQHRLLHTGAKPWKCKHCDKTFPQQSACTIHERTHTGDKPLSCNICGKKFSESSNLSKHRKIHGERGMHCCSYPGCTKSFHRLDQLKRHRTVHTRAEERMGKGKGSAESGSESGVTKTDSDLEG